MVTTKIFHYLNNYSDLVKNFIYLHSKYRGMSLEKGEAISLIFIRLPRGCPKVILNLFQYLLALAIRDSETRSEQQNLAGFRFNGQPLLAPLKKSLIFSSRPFS
jgi:hypothetical protein